MRKTFAHFLWFGVILALCYPLARCVPPEKRVDRDVSFLLSDPVIQDILDFQDRRSSDSLLPFLEHSNAAYRMLAARAFGSIQDSSAVDTLIGMLNDQVAEVRGAAAFALGQIGSAKAEEFLVRAFDRSDTTGYYHLSNAAILEAIGKCGGPKYLNALATISSYGPGDTLLLLGQTRGIYQYALRGITLTEATGKMIEYAIDPSLPSQVRLMATHYLARTRNINYTEAVPDLILRLRKEGDPDIRMALSTAIGKSRTDAGREVLIELLPEEPDHRVRANMIRALDNYPASSVRAVMFQFLRDPHPMVAQLAADHFVEKGNEPDALQYRQLARDTFHWTVTARLYRAANRHIPYFYTITKNNLRFEIERAIRSAGGYHKAALLTALSEDPRNYQVLINEAKETRNPAIVRTAAAEALKETLKHPELDIILRGTRRNVEIQILEFFQDAALSGDAGLTAVAGAVFQDKTIRWSPESWEFLKKGMDKLSLPRDLESYRELQKAYAERTGTSVQLFDAPFTRPISWTALSRINDSTEAVVRTGKGSFAIRLLPEVAPGSVSNFLQLAQQGFFDEKVFHRIVPNFVSQGGCPRGDGYGSLDFTIRSEFGQVYYDDEGWVGMASAGKDTEGTQFFITHSPTPHLDGRYTIFGKVSKGMDQVHRLTQGDTIKSIILNGLL